MIMPAKIDEKPLGITLEELTAFLRIVAQQSKEETPAGMVLLHSPKRGWYFALSYAPREVKRMTEMAPFLRTLFFDKTEESKTVP